MRINITNSLISKCEEIWESCVQSDQIFAFLSFSHTHTLFRPKTNTQKPLGVWRFVSRPRFYQKCKKKILRNISRSATGFGFISVKIISTKNDEFSVGFHSECMNWIGEQQQKEKKIHSFLDADIYTVNIIFSEIYSSMKVDVAISSVSIIRTK